MIKRILTATAAISMMAMTSPATAQNQAGLVNVNISDLNLENIANNLSVEVSQIPVNVQVPVSVAANICGVAVNALATQKKNGPVSCDAASGSEAAVTQALSKQMRKTNKNK